MTHPECLSQESLRVLRAIKELVSSRGFLLAGGTGLALQLGHRLSVDLDFFTNRRFSNEDVIGDLKRSRLRFKASAEEEGTLVLILDGVKASFFLDRYSLLEPKIFFEDVPLAKVEDIAAMKVLAIVQGVAKRDFIDLFFILQEFPFHKIAKRIVGRYGPERINPLHVGKSLVYFADADADPDPRYMPGFETAWDSIKDFYKGHVKQFAFDLEEALKGQ